MIGGRRSALWRLCPDIAAKIAGRVWGVKSEVAAIESK